MLWKKDYTSIMFGVPDFTTTNIYNTPVNKNYTEITKDTGITMPTMTPQIYH